MRLMRHGLQILLLVLAFGYALGPRTAHAQDTDEVKDLLEEPRSRQGYWVGFGGTYIGAGLREQGCVTVPASRQADVFIINTCAN